MKAVHKLFLIMTFAHNIHAAVLEHEIVNNTDNELSVELTFIGPRETKIVTVAPQTSETVTSEACLQKVAVTDPEENIKESRIEPKCIKQKITIEPKDTSWHIVVVAPDEQLKKGERV